MKNAFYTITILFALLLSACKKKETLPENDLTEDNITACQVGASCNFLFADNSGMDESKLLLTKGQYRVFWAQATTNYAAFSLYMMAPMIGDHFVLTKEDFLAGRIKYQNNCAYCFAASMVPIDGKIKGKKLPKVAGLPEKWLIEADVIFSTGTGSASTNNLHLKQYYTSAN